MRGSTRRGDRRPKLTLWELWPGGGTCKAMGFISKTASKLLHRRHCSSHCTTFSPATPWWGILRGACHLQTPGANKWHQGQPQPFLHSAMWQVQPFHRSSILSPLRLKSFDLKPYRDTQTVWFTAVIMNCIFTSQRQYQLTVDAVWCVRVCGYRHTYSNSCV